MPGAPIDVWTGRRMIDGSRGRSTELAAATRYPARRTEQLPRNGLLVRLQQPREPSTRDHCDNSVSIATSTNGRAKLNARLRRSGSVLRREQRGRIMASRELRAQDAAKRRRQRTQPPDRRRCALPSSSPHQEEPCHRSPSDEGGRSARTTHQGHTRPANSSSRPVQDRVAVPSASSACCSSSGRRPATPGRPPGLSAC